MKINFFIKKISTLILTSMLVLGGSNTALASAHKTVILRDNLSVPGVPADNGFPLKISLAPGYGVTLNFGSLGESISSVWLDNPSFATIDINGQNGGSVIHIKRIKTLDIDGVINTPTTGLTVVTKTPQGLDRVYLFKVVKTRYPSILLFDFYRPERRQMNACGTVGIEAEIARKRNLVLVSKLKESMSIAYADGFLNVDSPLNERLNELMGFISCGMPMPEATAKAGVSNQFIDSLLNLSKSKLTTNNRDENDERTSTKHESRFKLLPQN